MGSLTISGVEQALLFQNLSQKMKQLLTERFVVQTIREQEILFQQGQARIGLFLVMEGEISIVDDKSENKVLFTAFAGNVLGESCLVETGNYSSSAVALTPVKVGFLSVQQIKHIREEIPELFIELVVRFSKVMANRIASASRSDRGRNNTLGLGEIRIEHDLLGEKEVPQSALWGIQTLRAMENFQISGVRLDLYPEMIEALAHIKRACGIANYQLGQLDKGKKQAIVQACDEIIHGLWHGHFVVDMVQGGAGTSTNMNANEVIANRALEILGEERGSYDVLHPNTDVNMSQSTNDVYPSAIKIAILKMIYQLLAEVDLLADSFKRKGKEFARVLKMGRTQLQDAVPMTLGQEFNAWGQTILEGGKRIRLAIPNITELNLGGTAIGTGINTDPRYAEIVLTALQKETGMPLKNALDLVEATQDTSSFVELAGVFKMLAVRLSKICNDLRLLSSGPRCGFNEINLPAVQPGSSIMPGKVNPVIPEVVNQVAFQIIGLDNAVALASEGGQLELNVFEPLIAYNLFTSIRMLTNAMSTLRIRCIEGITANEEHCKQMVYNSIGIVTALNPHLGYERTSKVAKEALVSGKSVYDLVLEYEWMQKEQLEAILSPEAMLQPSYQTPKFTNDSIDTDSSVSFDSTPRFYKT